ncbi:MAG: NAD(P)/FAD-dependent oxidoreductase [Anaerolineales bacterium]
MSHNDVIVIGAGPGGLATGLQLMRYGIKAQIFEQDKIGGLLRNANLVENYPGFPGGIPGSDLVRLFEEHARANSLQITPERVIGLNHNENRFEVRTSQNVYQSQIVVIATGTKPRKFTDLKIPEQFINQVLYEVYPVLTLEGRRIAIVGAGDAAFDYAMNLSRKNKVMILNHGEQIKCLPLLWDRASASPNISYHPHTRISKLTSSDDLEMCIECITPDGIKTIKVDLLIGAIGRDPQLDFLSGNFHQKAIQLESSGELYYVGDVANGLYRQTSIAVGDGILAAMRIYRHLEEKV